MLWRRKCNVHERTPLRSLRLPNQTHVRFLRKPVAFACVTPNARANYIFPCRGPASIARHNMIEIQLISLKNFTAILAGVLVALENVVTRKLHFLFRKPIKEEQNNHARHADLPRNGCDHFVFWRGYRKIAPTFEIMRPKIVSFVRRDDVGMARIDQRERAPRRADVHRLPQAIEHQNLTV